MRPLIEKLRKSALPHALGACLAVAALMPDSAQASDYCRQTSKAIGKEIAVGDASRADRALAGLIGAAVGVMTGEVICGPDQQTLRAQQREQERILREQERLARAQQRAYEKAYEEAVREQARRDAAMNRMPVASHRAMEEQRMLQDRVMARMHAQPNGSVYAQPVQPPVLTGGAQPAPGSALAAIAQDMESFHASRQRRPGY